MTLKIIFKDIGRLQIILGALMLVPLLVSLVYLETYSALSFLLSGAIVAATGYIVYRMCRNAPEPENKHGYLTAAVGWLSIAFSGSLPFLIAALITPLEAARSFVPAGESYESSLAFLRSPLNAIFESMSGYTTTGLTMVVHEPSVGYGLLFYRSFAQWIGGVGVIVLALAILRRPSGSQVVSLYSSESSGEKLRPNIIGTARAVWKIYLAVTVLVTVYLTVGTMIIMPDYGFFASLYDGVNHAMTAQSTGGFSVLDDSIAGYNSDAMDVLHMLPMLMGAISIAVYYKAMEQRSLKAFWKDIQFRLLLIFMAVGTPILIFFLLPSTEVQQPVLDGAFQFISGLSTTGWQTTDITTWPPEAVFFIVTSALIVGGSVGATVGGMKIIRAYWILWGIRWKVLSAFLPKKAVQTAKIGGKVLNVRQINKEMAEVSIFAFLYLFMVLIGTIVTLRFMGDGFTAADALFESASAQGTVGLSSGITVPEMSPFLKVFYILQMWTGRLEIIPVLVLVRSIIWGTKARRL